MRQKNILFVVGVLCIGLMFAVLSQEVAFAETKVINLKFSNYFPPPSNQSKLCAEFIKDFESRTQGRVKVRYFPGGSLLKAPATIKGIDSGIVDIGLSHISYTAGRFPVMEVCELPHGYPTGWVANQIMNEFYHKFKPKEFDKYKVLWFHANSPSMVISKKPVRKLEDMKGLTLRAPGRTGEVVRALGASAAPTPIMETYDAIAKGVIQGVFVPFETLRTFKFAEIAKYVTVSWQIGPSYPFYVLMNKKSYEKLPPDIKAILNTLAGEYRDRFALMWNAIEFPGKAFGEKKGVEYIELSGQEATRWKKAVKPVIENYVKSMISKGYQESEVRGWIKYIQERTAYLYEKQKFYQIKSPSGPSDVRP